MCASTCGARRVELPAGRNKTVSATCIVAREYGAPADVKPIEWRLLTNRVAAAADADAVSELIDWYRARWEMHGQAVSWPEKAMANRALRRSGKDCAMSVLRLIPSKRCVKLACYRVVYNEVGYKGFPTYSRCF